MAPKLPETEKPLAGVLEAEAAGHVLLVDEHARPVAVLDALDRRVWAHLTDAADGKVYVHALRAGRDLLEARYQALLGLEV
jgi:antitoxin (DNA-binding transcriptional repressor) of toxin-antitoxin stability system